MEIRYIDGEMPFDRDGQHATGREVAEWVHPTSGGDPVLCWFPEYEGDDTVNLPCTESEIWTADKETGSLIEKCESIEEAAEKIRQYEEYDKEEGTYQENFYDIVNEKHESL